MTHPYWTDGPYVVCNLGLLVDVCWCLPAGKAGSPPADSYIAERFVQWVDRND